MKIKNIFASAILTMSILFASLTAANAGTYRGYQIIKERVDAYDTMRYDPLTYIAGELAAVEITGDRTTDLDLYVYDAYGNLVVKDDRDGDHCLVNWYPSASAKYYIVVVNRGRFYNDYIVETN